MVGDEPQGYFLWVRWKAAAVRIPATPKKIQPSAIPEFGFAFRRPSGTVWKKTGAALVLMGPWRRTAALTGSAARAMLSPQNSCASNRASQVQAAVLYFAFRASCSYRHRFEAGFMMTIRG